MNRSEQIQEKLKCLSELEDLLSPLIIEEDKQVAIEGLSEVQERLKELVGKIEMLLQAKENYHDIIQKVNKIPQVEEISWMRKIIRSNPPVSSKMSLLGVPTLWGCLCLQRSFTSGLMTINPLGDTMRVSQTNILDSKSQFIKVILMLVFFSSTMG